MGKQGWGRRGKTKKQQPNLARAAAAIGRLVSGHDGEESGSSGGAGDGKGTKRKLSRKEQRKKARTQKKQKKAPAKPTRPTVAGDAAGAPEPGRGGRDVASDSTTVKIKSRKKGKGRDDADAGDGNHGDGKNRLFYEMVQGSGLLAADGDGPAAEVEDEDDREIREMRKKLKLKGKKELGEGGDGLEDILNYKADAIDAMKDHYGDGLDDILRGMEDPDGFADDGRLDDDDTDADDDDDGEDIDEVIGLDSDDEAALDGSFDDGDDAAGDAELEAALTGSDSGSGEDDEYEGEADSNDDEGVGGVDPGGDGSAGSGSGTDGSDDDDDEEEEEEAAKKADDANTQYIKRADAYGNQSAGMTEAGKTLTTATRYVPPGRRGVMDSADDAQKMARAARQVKGLLNKLNAANLTVIVKEIVDVYGRNSRNEVSTVITGFVLDACIGHESTLKHLLGVYAGGIAALHHMVGMEVTAHFVRDLAMQFDANYKAHVARLDSAAEGAVVVDKQCTNLLSLLAYLYNYKIVHSVMIMGLLKKLLASFNELDIELILVLLKISGHRLKSDDREVLDGVIVGITQRAQAAEAKPRVRFMLDSIADLKGNKKKLVKDSSSFDTLFKAVRSFVHSQHSSIRDPMRVPWQDILEADTKGRWWLVGSAWVGNQADGSTAGSAGMGPGRGAEDGVGGAQDEHDPNKPSDAMVAAAAKQRMNTDVRRQIFYIVMGSEDYLDAFEKIIRLKLVGKQDREVIRVLLDCCLQEKTYNPYYSILATKLCQNNHNHKFTLQFACWDRFKELDNLTVPQTSNLARMLAHFINEHALSLSMLKVVEFNTLGGTDLLFFQLLMVTLLTRYTEDETSTAFERISAQANLSTLKNALLLFLRHYVRGFTLGIGNGGLETALAPADKVRLLKTRLRVAQRWLTLSADGLS